MVVECVQLYIYVACNAGTGLQQQMISQLAQPNPASQPSQQKEMLENAMMVQQPGRIAAPASSKTGSYYENGLWQRLATV